MTLKLRIDLIHKTEWVRFSGIPPFNYLTAMDSYLSFGAKNAQVWSRHVILYESKLELSKLAKVSYTHKGKFDEIFLTKLRSKNSVILYSFSLLLNFFLSCLCNGLKDFPLNELLISSFIFSHCLMIKPKVHSLFPLCCFLTKAGFLLTLFRRRNTLNKYSKLHLFQFNWNICSILE